MTIRWMTKQLMRLFGYAVLLTLPITLFPTIQAIAAGTSLALFRNRHISEGVRGFGRELERFSFMNQFSVPGAPTIWEYMDKEEPFRIPLLHTTDWARKLGLILPRGHTWDDLDMTSGIDNLASFEGAVRDIQNQHGMPTQYWVYVSSLAMPTAFPWDAAFLQLLEYHNAHPLPNDTAVAHIRCVSSPFLCNVWQIESPAFVHFVVREDGGLEDEVDATLYNAAAAYLRPIEVRIIDLGLQENSSTLLPDTFPTMFEQMKSLTTNDGVYSNFEEYDGLFRLSHLHYRWFSRKANQPGSILGHVTDLDNWTTKHLAKPIGLEDALHLLVETLFTASAGLTIALLLIKDFVWDTITRTLLARPTEFDRLAEQLQRRAESQAGAGLFGGMMGDFFDFVNEKLEQEAADSLYDKIVTTTMAGS